jgi:hypothetical protein
MRSGCRQLVINRYSPASKERLNEAFIAFTRHELVMCREKEMPTAASAIPRNCEEMMKRRGR